jgi:hypothetical protein
MMKHTNHDYPLDDEYGTPVPRAYRPHPLGRGLPEEYDKYEGVLCLFTGHLSRCRWGFFTFNVGNLQKQDMISDTDQ